ncbi:hypothetical protein GCM10008111_11480 [Alishewanella tabrizica]|uniref:Uncharacterized protein n=2 Tax=Alishewanella tabrizica TaxID=671278 RepID=A0ABQ2WJZ2_9ALTE|nr:hypothetical protein GCM10008111_11480 [Alishewanella tabrizica]
MASVNLLPIAAIDDIDFSAVFGRDVAELYTEAAKFQHSLPEFSLLRMRQVVEALCMALAEHVELALPDNPNLYQLIVDLKDSGKFKKAIADDLHFVRIEANKYVHKESQKSARKENKATNTSAALHEATQQCRDALCRILVDFARAIKGEVYASVLQQRQFSTLTHQDLIAIATTSLKPKDKFLAGVATDALTQEFLNSVPNLVATEQQKFHYWSLLRLSATWYLAAIELDAELDQIAFSHHADPNQSEKLIFSRSKPEYLFRFADVVVHGDIGDDWRAKGMLALQAAVAKGDAASKALLGGLLYFEEKFDLALKLLLEADAAGELRALKVLFWYYAEGKACQPDLVKARQYLDRGVERGFIPAIALLGRSLYEGEYLEKDEDKGREYLELAVQSGDRNSALVLEKDNLVSFMQQQFQVHSAALVAELKRATKVHKKGKNPYSEVKTITKKPKVGVNEPCPCGSGKKYKKCHGNAAKAAKTLTQKFGL